MPEPETAPPLPHGMTQVLADPGRLMYCDICFDSDVSDIIEGKSTDFRPMYFYPAEGLTVCFDCIPTFLRDIEAEAAASMAPRQT